MAIAKREAESKVTTQDIELALVSHFNERVNTIVPNVSWGIGLSYEIDLMVISKSMYATEIEIKISDSDIAADHRKSKNAHRSKLVKYFYYAVPEHLKESKHLPTDCGLLVLNKRNVIYLVRPPRINKDARKLTVEEYCKILHLASMRVWNLKRSVKRFHNTVEYWKTKCIKSEVKDE